MQIYNNILSPCNFEKTQTTDSPRMTEHVRVQILLRLLECISGNLEVVWITQKLTCYKSTSWRAERAFFARELSGLFRRDEGLF